MNDRSDELSTADLAGQNAGSGTAGEHAVRGEPADQMGERRGGLPGDRSADTDYADDRSEYADDRVGGMGSGEVPGGTPADRAAYADEEPTMASDRTGYVSDRGDAAGGPDRYADDRVGDTGGDTGNADLAGDRTGYGPSGAEVTGSPVADDRGFGGGVGGRGVGAGTAEGGYPTGEPTVASTGAASGTGGATGAGSKAGPLLGEAESEGFRARWTDVQTGFVDAPRRSVEQADALVAELMQHLAKTFADERSGLESQWDRGEDIPTDDLRTAFQRYRSFFERLLST